MSESSAAGQADDPTVPGIPAPADEAPAPASRFATDAGSPRQPFPSGSRVAGEIDEPSVAVSRGLVGLVRAREVTVQQSGVGAVVAGNASLRMGGASGILARQATLQMGGASTVVAADARIERSLVRTVVANTVHAGPTTAILLVLARRVDGEPKVLLDWRGALAIGASIVALALIGRRRKA